MARQQRRGAFRPPAVQAEVFRQTVTIAGLGHEGDGVAEPPDGPAGGVFVPFTLPGETVEIDRVGERGVLRAILAASPERVAPPCRHFGICGGCALQHWDSARALSWKHQQVVAAFAQRGIDFPVAPVIAVPAHSRRRVVFAAERVGRETVFGLAQRGSHALVALTECVVAHPAIAGRLELLRAIATAAIGGSGGATVTVVAADNGLDIAIDIGRAAATSNASALAVFASRPEIARISIGEEVVFLARRPEIGADGATLLPVPGGFLQASAAAEAAMVRAVLAGVGDATNVADLFAGIGTFALRLARHARVTAVEGEAILVAALEEGARRSRGLKAVVARRRDLFSNPVSVPELKPFEAVVFDPPRAGAKAQAEALAASKVKRVVAVSCNPATLARDARILIDGGYRLTSVQPIDQFLYTAHVEAVATFVR